MELLPLLQGLSTPVLLVIGGLVLKGNNSLHKIDKRLTLVEYQITEHRKTEGDTDGDS